MTKPPSAGLCVKDGLLEPAILMSIELLGETLTDEHNLKLLTTVSERLHSKVLSN